MKILLLITVCEQNKERVNNQIINLNKHRDSLSRFNITPIFVHGNQDLSIDIPYETLKVDVEEKYSNLHKKIIESLCIIQNRDFDFLIKIDDDTLFNIDLLDTSFLKDNDYIGRFEPSFTENYIKIHIPMYNFYDNIPLYPSIFQDKFKFATGDFYILSKKAINYIITQKSIFYTFSDEDYICEDQLIGFILNNLPVKTHDINYSSEETKDNALQITKKLMSLHPINSVLFNKIINLSPSNQLEELFKFKMMNLSYRKVLINKIGNDIKKLLLDFANSKKTMGLG